MLKAKGKAVLLAFGDIVALYVALLLTLYVRYGGIAQWELHAVPFLWIHIIWLVIFYSAGMYDWQRFPPTRRYYIAKLVFTTMAISGVVAVGMFYFVSAFSITPRINLLLDMLIASVLLWVWRIWFVRFMSKGSKIKVVFFGSTDEITKFSNMLDEKPSFGYRTELLLNEAELKNESGDGILKEFIRDHAIDLVVVEPSVLQNKELVKMLYEVLPLGVTILNFAEFYEAIMGKVPTSLVTETWFLENLAELDKRSFELIKRLSDIAGAAILGISVLLLLPFVALLIKLDSKGPVFYRQKRVGQNGKVFQFLKFRSMVQNADAVDGFKGTGDDMRHTRVGKFMRKTYLDELPQIINVLRGEMSFIGPRPERPKYVDILRQQIPFYEIRLLVRPGITGWAQIRMTNDASVEDAPEKLQYDLYYIKNRSFVMDLGIALKTAAILASRSGR